MRAEYPPANFLDQAGLSRDHGDPVQNFCTATRLTLRRLTVPSNDWLTLFARTVAVKNLRDGLIYARLKLQTEGSVLTETDRIIADSAGRVFAEHTARKPRRGFLGSADEVLSAEITHLTYLDESPFNAINGWETQKFIAIAHAKALASVSNREGVPSPDGGNIVRLADRRRRVNKG